MKNSSFNAAIATLAASCVEVFNDLYSVARPLPEGVEVRGNVTGYFDPMVNCCKDVPSERNVIYKATDDKGRRLVIVPVANFYGLQDKFGSRGTGKSLVFFERYSGGNCQVLIEQLTTSNNTPGDAYKVTQFAELMFLVGDWLV